MARSESIVRENKSGGDDLLVRPIVFLVEDDIVLLASLRALFESVALQVECFSEAQGLLRRLGTPGQSLSEIGVVLARPIHERPLDVLQRLRSRLT